MVYDINSALERLEQNLNNLDSAREQVEKTVTSYNTIGTKIETYTTALDSVSQSVTSLIEIIKGNNASLTKDTNLQLQDVVDSFSNAVNGIKSIINETSDKFKRETNTIGQAFSKGVETINNNLSSRCEDIASKYKVSIDKASISFGTQTTEAIKAFNIVANKVLLNYETLNAAIKEKFSEEQKIISDTKNEILHINEEQTHIILEKINQLEQRNQILQRWIYTIVALNIILLCLRFV